jgi:hypothetical protein
MPTPSFILPSAPVYEEGTLYGLELYGSNFVPSPMSFTRATTATRVNADGLVELVPYNLLQRSNTFNNAIWQLIGTPTITANYDTNPLTGENDAWRFQSSGNSQRIYQGLNNSFCTFSLYAKGSGNIKIQDNSSNYYTILTLTSSWQRFLIYIPASLTNVQILSSAGGCDATIYGAQLVEGTEALPYLKTETRLNRPRVDFSLPGCPNLLLEPQRTNLLTYSEDFSNASWSKQDITVNSNFGISPDGTLNADKLTEGTGTAQHRISNIKTITSGVPYSVSCYVKRDIGTRDFAIISINSGSRVYFNLTNGTVGTENLGVGTIEDVGNGWYKCSATGTSTATSNTLYLAATNGNQSGSETYTGDGVSSLLIYGAQLESGAYSTSYIPTTSASVTRNADVASKTGISSLINSEEGVLYAEIKGFISFDTIEPNRYITLTNGTSNERVALLLGGNNNQLRAIIYSSTQSMNLSFTTSLNDVKQFNKLAVKYKSGDYAFFVNGVKIDGSIITNAFPANTLTKLSFDVGDGTQQFRGYAKDVIIYNTALTDDELEALTGEGFNTYAEMASYYNYTLQ